MKQVCSVTNKEEAVNSNRKLYNGEFGESYDKTHNLEQTNYVQKIFFLNLKNILGNLKDQKTKLHIIDVGTGTGSLSLHFYKNIRALDTVVNLDISEKMLNILKSKLTTQQINQSDFVAEDAFTYLSQTEISFDLICFAASLHHFYDYEDVIDIACKKISDKGFLYIAVEPKRTSNSIEKKIRNFENIIFRYRKKEFGFIKLLIKIIYLPFHFLNPLFKLEGLQASEAIDNNLERKAEVVSSGLDLEKIIETLNLNHMKLIILSGGPDYVYPFTFKLLNYFHINSHFQLIAQKQ